MITVHHLENSRSQRILWLLEELGVEYDIVFHQRDKSTNLAPAALKEIHPLGRAPVIEDGDRVIAESATIIEYLLEKYDTDKRFSVTDDDVAAYDHKFWLHFAEGSLMPSLVTKMVLNKGKQKVGFPFSLITNKFVQGVIEAYFGPNLDVSIKFVEDHLQANHGFVGANFTAADFQMIFPLEALVATGQTKQLPAISAYVQRIHKRDAYQQALAKGGEYAYATSV